MVRPLTTRLLGFLSSIVIPNTPPQTVANAHNMNVIVHKVPEGLWTMERSEDVFLKNYMQNALHFDQIPRISLPTVGKAFTHEQFISQFKSTLATKLENDDKKTYTISVRFDMGSKAGMSGIDAFAPHLVFEIDSGMGRSKRPNDTEPKEPKEPKKPKKAPKSPLKRKSGTGALNGNDSIVNRPWTDALDEVEDDDDDSSESSNGVDPKGQITPHVLFGDKVRPGQPRPVELLVEHHRKSALEAAGHAPPLYLSSPSSQSDVDFGDVSTPVAMMSQMVDDTDVEFHAQLMIDLKTASCK